MVKLTHPHIHDAFVSEHRQRAKLNVRMSDLCHYRVYPPTTDSSGLGDTSRRVDDSPPSRPLLPM